MPRQLRRAPHWLSALPRVRLRGEAVQVDPIKPKLKASTSKRLKLRCDSLLSIFAFKFSLRRYSEEHNLAEGCQPPLVPVPPVRVYQYPGLDDTNFKDAIEACLAGAYTRPLFSSTLSRFGHTFPSIPVL